MPESRWNMADQAGCVEYSCGCSPEPILAIVLSWPLVLELSETCIPQSL